MPKKADLKLHQPETHHVEIRSDLLGRLTGPGFSDHERVVLLAICRDQFGHDNRGSSHAAPRNLTLLTGRIQSRLAEAMRGLTDRGVVASLPDRSRRLRTSPAKWQPRNQVQARLWEMTDTLMDAPQYSVAE